MAQQTYTSTISPVLRLHFDSLLEATRRAHPEVGELQAIQWTKEYLEVDIECLAVGARSRAQKGAPVA
ncbi:MAG TPA: hypothetical protein VIU62_13585 [Chloroflexota bacterium]|jgi:hypothetical protein